MSLKNAASQFGHLGSPYPGSFSDATRPSMRTRGHQRRARAGGSSVTAPESARGSQCGHRPAATRSRTSGRAHETRPGCVDNRTVPATIPSRRALSGFLAAPFDVQGLEAVGQRSAIPGAQDLDRLVDAVFRYSHRTQAARSCYRQFALRTHGRLQGAEKADEAVRRARPTYP